MWLLCCTSCICVFKAMKIQQLWNVVSISWAYKHLSIYLCWLMFRGKCFSLAFSWQELPSQAKFGCFYQWPFSDTWFIPLLMWLRWKWLVRKIKLRWRWGKITIYPYSNLKLNLFPFFFSSISIVSAVGKCL